MCARAARRPHSASVANCRGEKRGGSPMPPRAWLERRPRMAKKIVICLSVCVLWACLGLFYPCFLDKKGPFFPIKTVGGKARA